MIIIKLKQTVILLLLATSIYSGLAQNKALNQKTIVQDSTFVNSKIWIDDIGRFYDQGSQEAAVTYADSILKIITPKNASDSTVVAEIYYTRGIAKFEQLKDYESIESLHFARAIGEKLSNNKELLSRIYYNLHINFGVQSKLFETLKYGEKALNILEDSDNPNHDLLLKLYSRMAVYAAMAGAYFKSENYLEKGEELLETLPKNSELKNSKVSYQVKLLYRKMLIAFIYQSLNLDENFDNTAIINSIENDKIKLDNIFNADKNLLLKQSDTFYYDDADVYYYALALNYYCLNHAKRKNADIDFITLQKEIDKAIGLLHEKHHPRHLYQFKSTKGRIYLKEAKHKEALSISNDIIANTDDKNNNRSNFYLHRALIYLKEKNITKAKEDIYTALSLINSGSNDLRKDFSNFIGGYKFTDVTSLQQLAKEIEASDFKFDDKENYYTSIYQAAFEQFVATYKDQGLNKVTNDFLNSILKKLAAKQALTNKHLSEIENIQNYLAWQSFNQSRNLIHMPVIDSLEQIEFSLRKQITNAKRIRNSRALDSLSNQLYSYKENLQSDYPEISKAIQNDFDIVEFQQDIKEDEIVLKYMFFENEFIIFQITKNSVSYELKPWRDVDKIVFSEHLDAIKNSRKKASYNANLRELLIPDEALQYQKLIIIPDALIYQLPFETLVHNDEFLVKSKTIRYSSHLRFVYSNPEKEVQKDISLTIYAPEYLNDSLQSISRSSDYFLEGAKDEAKAISNIFRSEAFLGKEATKTAFLTSKSNGDILHLAMHASINKDEPELSYFNFSDDEKLHIEELYGLNLNADLAVLSACNTGVGNSKVNSGIESLQRAFTFAGVPSTVASLWEVPDQSTKEIMVGFYENLKKGDTKSKALQRAKLDYIKNNANTKLAEPYYWAGFVIYGRDDAVSSSSSEQTLLIVLGVFILSALVFFLWMRYRKTNIS